MKSLFGSKKRIPKLKNARQIEKRLSQTTDRKTGKTIHQTIAFNSAIGHSSVTLQNVSFTLDLDAGGADSIMSKAHIPIHVENLRICSFQTFTASGKTIPLPQPGSNTKYIPNSYTRNGNIITWTPPNGVVPANEIVMFKIHFLPKENLADKSKIVVRGYRTAGEHEEVIGVDYIIRK